MSDDIITETTSDLGQLRRDADRNAPLERVSFVEGMLLGVEATRAEQEYHRRRLTRHQFWLNGCGTIAGLGVWLQSLSNAQPGGTVSTETRLVVNAGIGIDRFGREILIPEPYCIDLNAWLLVNDFGTALTAVDATTHQCELYLYLMTRQAAYGRNLTPVLARELNSGTDAVAYGRTADGFALELVLDEHHGGKHAEWSRGLGPWQGDTLNQFLSLAPVSGAEAVDAGTGVPNADDVVRAAKQAGLSEQDLDECYRRLRLLAAYSSGSSSSASMALDEQAATKLASAANVPLASVRLTLGVDANNKPVRHVDASHVLLNNLVRPFVRTPVHTLIPGLPTDIV